MVSGADRTGACPGFGVMNANSEFVENLHEVFTLFGAIETKRMFGGHGVYHEGLMFALVADDVLYLKADDDSSDAFESLGLPQFEYVKSGRKMSMSYYAAPDDIFDDPEHAREWADRAFEAALRSRHRKNKAGVKRK